MQMRVEPRTHDKSPANRVKCVVMEPPRNLSKAAPAAPNIVALLKVRRLDTRTISTGLPKDQQVGGAFL